MTDSAAHPEGAIRLGIFGCGAAARNCHIPAMVGRSGYRLSALHDLDLTRTRAAADRYADAGGDPSSVVQTTDLADALDAIDAAVVAANHAAHAPLTEALLAGGKHVLVEKPFAVRLDEADRMVALARQHPGQVLATAFVRRLFPGSVWLKSMLDAGRVGTIRSVTWREGYPYQWPLTSPSMFLPHEAGGGVLIDTGAHVLDLLLWWLGEPNGVARYADDNEGGVESESLLRLAYPGFVAEVALSRLRELENVCQVTGSAATITMGTGFAATYEIVDHGSGQRTGGPVPVLPPARDDWVGLFAGQLDDFAAACRRAAAPYADAGAGRRVVALTTECYARRERTPLPKPWTAAPGTADERLDGLRVAVSGASGFLGARVVERLLSGSKASVQALVRGYGRLARLSSLDQSRLGFVAVDVTDPATLRGTLDGCDVLIHLAYGNDGDDDTRWRTTVDGTAALVEEARRAGVGRVVHISSVAVHRTDGIPVIAEDSPLIEATPGDRSYPVQKLESERLVRAVAAAGGPDAVILRPTVIYGPWAPDWTARPLRRLLAGEALPTGDRGVCNAVHVDDVVTAILRAAVTPGAAGTTLLISGTQPITWGGLYDGFRRALGLALPSGPAPEDGLADWERALYDSAAVVDVRRAADVLGYRPAVDLADGMRQVGEWARWAGIVRQEGE